MPSNIPPSTLDAARHDDPAWWDECAAFHELAAQWFESDDIPDGKAHHAAAALACRTFALMMRRAGEWCDKMRLAGSWRIDEELGFAVQDFADDEYYAVSPRTLPAAAADALLEEAAVHNSNTLPTNIDRRI